jgi:hypothetical protein
MGIVAVVSDVYGTDLSEGAGGMLGVVGSMLKTLMVVLVIAGPILLGGAIGWLATFEMDRDAIADSVAAHQATGVLASSELKAVGVSPEAATAIMRSAD